MGLKPIEQLREFISKSNNILLLLPQNPSGDAIGSGWAFYFFLENLKKKVTLAYSDTFNRAEKFSFLPTPENITGSVSGARDFILSFNTKYNKIMNVRTQRSEEELKIFITPKHGAIDPRDFSFVPAKFKYDLILVFDSPDKESIGKIYEEDPDLFYEIPVVNIDSHSNNDSFAQINLVTVTASSTSEIVADILDQIDTDNIDKRIAQCLLAGIISATESFQKKNTTPKALQISAQLMEKGANQQKIIRWLYKTSPLHILKLWGRIMARLKWDEELKLSWSLVTLEDFVQSRSKPHDIPVILEKLEDNYASGKIFLVLYNETEAIIKGVIKIRDEAITEKLSGLFSNWERGSGSNVYQFRISGRNIIDAEKTALDKIRKAL